MWVIFKKEGKDIINISLKYIYFQSRRQFQVALWLFILLIPFLYIGDLFVHPVNQGGLFVADSGSPYVLNAAQPAAPVYCNALCHCQNPQLYIWLGHQIGLVTAQATEGKGRHWENEEPPTVAET